MTAPHVSLPSYLVTSNGVARCHDCAFTKGTVANGAPATLTRALLCVATHEAFDCHVLGGLCAGFVEASRAFGPVKPDRVAKMAAQLFEGCFQLALRDDRARMTPEQLGEVERIDRGEPPRVVPARGWKP